jgi:hypothetical protein
VFKGFVTGRKFMVVEETEVTGILGRYFLADDAMWFVFSFFCVMQV